jgi:hypothetical protein
LHEMMSLELAKQRREELLREAKLRRRAKALRAAHKEDASRRSAVVWEMMRLAQRLFKLLRKTLRKEPERRRKNNASSLSSEATSNRKERERS